MRTNKTKNNLQQVWNQLDEASGSLYNALDTIAQMTDMPDIVKRQADMIDVSIIDMLKNEIEEILEMKVKSREG